METKTIAVKFLGSIASLAGVEELGMEVDADLRRAAAQVKVRIEEMTGGKVLYNLAHNGVTIARVGADTVPIRDGDLFTVIPVLLGG